MSVQTAVEFYNLLQQLESYFAVETAAASVNTERFGTISRADVARLLPLAAEAAGRWQAEEG